ncbi:MAG: Ni/Fe-hydrogenase, b-type cytochrome subunit [Bifidobacteriaceae bacterium]|nr:Ni/Fe-hydrogenase, b-type cytochrome subunit [Bifidobacteriaceae bacterium]
MTAALAGQAPVSIGGVFTVRELSEGRILALAAAAPAASTDVVDVALGAAIRGDRPDLEARDIAAEDVDPATRERRYALTMIRGFSLEDGSTADVVAMRGSIEAVLANSTVSRKDRGLVRRNAAWVGRRGWRPLAVATAPVGPNDEVGEFRFQGFVDVGVGRPRPIDRSGPSTWARVEVWSASLRFQHWLNVAIVFTLSCTGYLIMDPFFGPEAHAGAQTGYLMGVIRFIHFTAAFTWVVVGLTRVVSAFVSRDRHLRWTEWWPIKSKRDLRNLGRVIQHYALIKEDSPLYVAHNPLQQLTYAALYCACGVQMITGFALYSLYHQSSPFWQVVATPVHIVGAPSLRLFHTMMMFALWMFVIIHVYLAVRADSLERHGGISSMINGGVWLRRGAKPVDAPEIG